ncbi:hypothetical protein C1I98_17665 [Spongiactinospora gelatinilytica]|uniref:Thioesterase domain-containing protein n=1 Tax=Spongiactinospora gelatinilytica TaxID=2666298 RepID=A0A2W2G7W2_9ACTN|nr:thioesterase domain-containing protein [Spongiactinospora gelatinilytica]PZG44113.1 hypothetical protein C1I98_17665 [Spongiactinospora gelatinilytica]
MNHIATHRTTRAHGWIVGAPRRRAATVRIFCLPYAGGTASAFGRWPAALLGHVEVCPIELPGRQTRWHDNPFTHAGPLVDALAAALAGEFDIPYALFGHSMGSLLAFELARELRRRGVGEPRVLFVSGGPAPQLPRAHPSIHDQPDTAVVAKLRTLGGLPDEIYESPELLELLMPTIRADFSVGETYEYRVEPPLTCPIVAFANRRPSGTARTRWIRGENRRRGTSPSTCCPAAISSSRTRRPGCSRRSASHWHSPGVAGREARAPWRARFGTFSSADEDRPPVAGGRSAVRSRSAVTRSRTE